MKTRADAHLQDIYRTVPRDERSGSPPRSMATVENRAKLVFPGPESAPSRRDRLDARGSVQASCCPARSGISQNYQARREGSFRRDRIMSQPYDAADCGWDQQWLW